MFRRLMLGAVVLAGLAAVLVSCGGDPPTQEINAAQAAIDSVRALPDVQQYAADQVSAAERSLAAVRQLVTDGEYEQARNRLPGIMRTVRGIPQQAASARTEAFGAVERMIASARAAVEEAEGKLPQAPRYGKGAIRDISVLRSDLEAAQADLAAAETAFSAPDLTTAQNKARSAMTKAQSVTRTVDDAIAASQRPRQ